MARVEWPRENREFNVSNRVEMFVCATEFNKEKNEEFLNKKRSKGFNYKKRLKGFNDKKDLMIKRI